MKPDDIPEDVCETAAKAMGTPDVYISRHVYPAVQILISRAILAERNRCMKAASQTFATMEVEVQLKIAKLKAALAFIGHQTTDPVIAFVVKDAVGGDAAPAAIRQPREGNGGMKPDDNVAVANTSDKRMGLAPAGGKVTLAECPVGLFINEYGGLCLKTEYGNNEGRIDAYIVDSGEFFWGSSPQSIHNQRRQMVTPVFLSAPPHPGDDEAPPTSPLSSP